MQSLNVFSLISILGITASVLGHNADPAIGQTTDRHIKCPAYIIGDKSFEFKVQPINKCQKVRLLSDLDVHIHWGHAEGRASHLRLFHDDECTMLEHEVERSVRLDKVYSFENNQCSLAKKDGTAWASAMFVSSDFVISEKFESLRGSSKKEL